MQESREQRKQLISQYKEREKQIGVFAIRNKNTGRLLLGKTASLDKVFNRHRFQLNNGSHPNKALQADWSQLGEDAFACEVVESLKEASDDPSATDKELDVLLELCRERIVETTGTGCFY